jgi:hypothetical protein
VQEGVHSWSERQEYLQGCCEANGEEAPGVAAQCAGVECGGLDEASGDGIPTWNQTEDEPAMGGSGCVTQQTSTSHSCLNKAAVMDHGSMLPVTSDARHSTLYACYTMLTGDRMLTVGECGGLLQPRRPAEFKHSKWLCITLLTQSLQRPAR